jgi:c(7)-type cytochrome triheme protein
MRLASFTLIMLGCFVMPALAVVGGGDIMEDGRRRFSHNEHVVAGKMKCPECHPKLYTNRQQHIKVTMEAMALGYSCGACHDGKKSFSVASGCSMCHKIKQ